MWKTSNDRVIVELKGLYDNEIKVGDFTMKVDTIFRKLHNAVQEATVVACPDNKEIEVGDTVFVHHFVVENERIVPVKDKHYRWLEYNQIYARMRDGILKALGYFVLVEPVKFDEAKFKNKTDSGLVLSRKTGTEYVDRVGFVAHVGDEAFEAGVSVGDKIFFNKNCEYEININGKMYYRMEKRDVIAVIDPNVEFTV